MEQSCILRLKLNGPSKGVVTVQELSRLIISELNMKVWFNYCDQKACWCNRPHIQTTVQIIKPQRTSQKTVLYDQKFPPSGWSRLILLIDPCIHPSGHENENCTINLISYHSSSWPVLHSFTSAELVECDRSINIKPGGLTFPCERTE